MPPFSRQIYFLKKLLTNFDKYATMWTKMYISVLYGLIF